MRVPHQIGVLSAVADSFLIPDNHIGRAMVSSVTVAHEDRGWEPLRPIRESSARGERHNCERDLMPDRATAIDGLGAAVMSRSSIAEAVQRAFDVEPGFLLDLLITAFAWQPVPAADELSTRDSELAGRRVRGEREVARETGETRLIRRKAG